MWKDPDFYDKIFAQNDFMSFSSISDLMALKPASIQISVEQGMQQVERFIDWKFFLLQHMPASVELAKFMIV